MTDCLCMRVHMPTVQAAVRGMHGRWVLQRRRSERREVRETFELLCARLAGAPTSL